MDTPLYDELVVKYYLSQDIVPFSYPHEPAGLRRVPKVNVSHTGPVDPTLGVTFNLSDGTWRAEKYDYFRLG